MNVTQLLLQQGADHSIALLHEADAITNRELRSRVRDLANGLLARGAKGEAVGLLAGNGFIFLRDRAREFIKPMGYRVSPLEIEEVLAQLPEVVMAAAFGVPDDLAGEAVNALVVPLASSDLSEEQLQRFCSQRLPAYKVPKRIGMVDALPTNQYGKIARARLLDVFRSVQATDGP